MLCVSLLLSLAAVGPQWAGPDTLRAAEREARQAAVRYERALVRSTPVVHSGLRSGDRCDERIGRYCLWYGTPRVPRRPMQAEAPAAAAAREAAIHAYRRWSALAPADARAAAPLIRYLIEAERASEAVAAARAHATAAASAPESLMLVGLALHYARDFAEAEDAFDRARAAMHDEDRRRLDGIARLLEPEDRRHYARLTDLEKAEVEARFWALADPWLMDAGNERRSAHYARHAWNRIMAQRPGVEGRDRWGSDDAEIVLRYGLPTARQRQYSPPGSIHRDRTLVEWFDPRRVALTPDRVLTRGISHTPEPGQRPEIERDTVRSQYAPLGLRRTRGLWVQPSVFPGPGGGTVRVDAILLPDTTAPPVPLHPAGLLVLLDTLGRELSRSPVAPRVRSDSTTVLSAETWAPPGAYVYRVEIRDRATGLGGMAQHRVDVAAADGLTLSDLLLAIPEHGGGPGPGRSARHAFPGLSLPPGAQVDVYAEVSGLAEGVTGTDLEVEWWIERADADGVLRRTARWLGEAVGLLAVDQPARVAWGQPATGPSAVIRVTLGMEGVDPGLHRLGLRVRDRVSGEERSSTRLVRIDPAAPPLPRPDER
jgi:hypothetical protein